MTFNKAEMKRYRSGNDHPKSVSGKVSGVLFSLVFVVAGLSVLSWSGKSVRFEE